MAFATLPENEIAYYKRCAAEVESLNEKQLLSDFDAILTTLKTKYGEYGSTLRDGSHGTSQRRSKAAEQTYADHLQMFEFPLKNLRSGQPLPRLAGRDVYGVDFDSERLKGKAILLFFTSKSSADRRGPRTTARTEKTLRWAAF